MEVLETRLSIEVSLTRVRFGETNSPGTGVDIDVEAEQGFSNEIYSLG
jgi:hypothetical protein